MPSFVAAKGCCSFCGADGDTLVTTDHFVFICDGCLGLCVSILGGKLDAELRKLLLDGTLEEQLAEPRLEAMLEEAPASELSAEQIATVLARVRAEAAASEPQPPVEFHCSFCWKPRDQVARLVSGPRVFICDVCLEDSVRCIHAASLGQSGT